MYSSFRSFPICKGDEFYIGTIREIPEVNTQGKTLRETKENLKDALKLYLDYLADETTLPGEISGS